MPDIEGEPIQILLIEDNEDHAELVMRSLRSHRVANKIIHLSDGQEALDYLNREGKYQDLATYPPPNLILLDLRLPKVDGLEVLKQIKISDKHHEIPVVIITSSSADRDVAQSYEYNANSYVVKPLDFKKFTDLMNDLGFYWLGWNTFPHR